MSNLNSKTNYNTIFEPIRYDYPKNTPIFLIDATGFPHVNYIHEKLKQKIK